MAALLLSPAAVAAEFTALIETYGEQVVMNRGGVTTTQSVVFTPANTLMISQFVDDNTAVGLIRPALVGNWDATTSGSNDPPQVNDTFSRYGRNYTVQAVIFYKLNTTLVLVSALAS